MKNITKLIMIFDAKKMHFQVNPGFYGSPPGCHPVTTLVPPGYPGEIGDHLREGFGEGSCSEVSKLSKFWTKYKEDFHTLDRQEGSADT